MIPIRSTVNLTLTIEDINHINEMVARDEALAVIPDEKEPEKWGYCPRCRKLTSRFEEDNFCRKCGQRLDVKNDAL